MVDGDRPRLRDADRTRAKILEAAVEEFASKGLDGARVEAVAARAASSKRMIFHYFGDKAGLHRAVLAAAYADAREAEAALQLDGLPATEALTRIIEHTFDYDEAHPDFVRLVAQENLTQDSAATGSEELRTINAEALKQLEAVLAQGRREQVFTGEITALDLHLLISALCFFRVSNRRTFGAAFGVDLSDADLRARHRSLVVKAVLEQAGARVPDKKPS